MKKMVGKEIIDKQMLDGNYPENQEIVDYGLMGNKPLSYWRYPLIGLKRNNWLDKVNGPKWHVVERADGVGIYTTIALYTDPEDELRSKEFMAKHYRREA